MWHAVERGLSGSSCLKTKAQWLKELVWADVRSFLENPGEVLQCVRERLAEDREVRLEERHASLTRRLGVMQEKKRRYVKLCTQGHLDEDELQVHPAEVRDGG